MEQSQFKPGGESFRSSRRIRVTAGFTLVEMMAAIAVLALIMVILTQSFTTISSSWTKNTGRANAFAGARAGFEALKLNLSQATLNTYVGYADKNGNPVQLYNPSFITTAGGSAANAAIFASVPCQYVRASELHFITGPAQAILSQPDVAATTTIANGVSGQAVFFQAPTGFVNTPADRPLGTLVNVLGYYVAYNNSADFTPAALTPPGTPSVPNRWRYRLMEVIQPAENNAIYNSTCESTQVSSVGATVNEGVYNYDLRWIGNLCYPPVVAPNPPGANAGKFVNTIQHPLAENIITVAMLPKLPDSETNGTDTTVSLPLSTDYTYDSRAWEPALAASPHPFTSGSGANADIRWRNQLPPLMELVVISIDEPSAIRLNALYGAGNTPPFANGTVKAKLDLTQVFKTYNPTNPAGPTVDTDITLVENGLNALGVNYRVFRTEVALNNSQWSSN